MRFDLRRRGARHSARVRLGARAGGGARRGPVSGARVWRRPPRGRATRPAAPAAGGRSCGGCGGARGRGRARARARRRRRSRACCGGSSARSRPSWRPWAGWRACRSLSWTLRPCRRYGLAPASSLVRACALAPVRARARMPLRPRTRTCARAHSRAAPPVCADHRAHAPHANACDVQPERLANAIAYKSLQGRCGLMVELASPTPHDGGAAVAAAATAWEKAGADAIAVSIDEEVRRAPAAAPSRSRSHSRACRRVFARAHALPRGRCAC